MGGIQGVFVRSTPSSTSRKQFVLYTIRNQNVQGLIPFGQLKDSNPVLDATKIFELSAHVNRTKMDVIILNETWLKRSIVDNEIFPSAQYKIFRRDRTAWSHPPDPLNANKFRRNGGGVLLAVRTELEITSKEIKLRSGAEIIAVESCTMFIICTCYRGGTLGMANHEKLAHIPNPF